MLSKICAPPGKTEAVFPKPLKATAFAVAAGYVGCMKTGQIFTDPNLRWYEPQHVLLGSRSYFAHAWGTAYVLSGRTAAFLATLPVDALRFFMNEGAPLICFSAEQ